MKLFKEKQPINKEVKVNFFVEMIGSGFYTGFIPVASGTFGSLVALLVYLFPGMSDTYPLLLLVFVFFIVGVYCSESMRKKYGEDPYQVVIDEIVGQWLTYLIGTFVFELFIKFKEFDPTFLVSTRIAFGIIGFFTFRFFDIIKLQPAKYFDNMENGYGIMMDDIISGIYAGVISAVLTHFVWFKVIVKIL